MVFMDARHFGKYEGLADYLARIALHSSVLPLLMKPWPLQALAPLHATWADAETATKVVAAKTAAAVEMIIRLFTIASIQSTMR